MDTVFVWHIPESYTLDRSVVPAVVGRLISPVKPSIHCDRWYKSSLRHSVTRVLCPPKVLFLFDDH